MEVDRPGMDLKSMVKEPLSLPKRMNEQRMNKVSPLLCVREAKEGQIAQETDAGWPETNSGYHHLCHRPDRCSGKMCSLPSLLVGAAHPKGVETEKSTKSPRVSMTLSSSRGGGEGTATTPGSGSSENWELGLQSCIHRNSRAGLAAWGGGPYLLICPLGSFLSGNGDEWENSDWERSLSFPWRESHLSTG